MVLEHRDYGYRIGCRDQHSKNERRRNRPAQETDHPRRAGLGLPPHTAVLDLKHMLRCQRCGARGRAVVSVLWADPA